MLAGGGSTRMGEPKALLDWEGSPLVVHVARVVAAAAAPVVVVGAPGQELPALPDGVEVARDAVAEQGPLEGLAAGMRAIGERAEAAFVCGADMPFLSAEAVGQLASALDANCDAVVVVGGEGRDQPLGAIYRLSLLAPRRGAARGRASAGSGWSPSARGRTASTETATCWRRSGA